ncbi:MAG TPA: TonB family protein [Pyrinomonadaceae bacterium]
MLKRINLTLTMMLVVVSGSSSVFASERLSFPSNALSVSLFNLTTETDRDRDGLAGPVRRVRTETAKLSNKGGKLVEGPRTALETASYDIKGSKTENAYFPVSGATLTGKEVYKYDDKGNIIEMTLQDASGTLLSKEVYTYEFDNFGNWTKMTTSVAVIEGGKINFEPTEITYRTITYYLDEATLAKLSQPAAATPKPSPAAVNVPVPSGAAFSSLTAPSVAAVNNTATSRPATGTVDSALMSSAPPPTATGSATMVKTSAAAPETKPKTEAEAAPRQAVVKPPVKPISGGVLNGKATSLPVPIYPTAARNARASGQVAVEVVIDGSGKVISAKAMSGHALLQQAAVQAAQQARFTPTLLSGQPVKISGIINYNFSLQQ